MVFFFDASSLIEKMLNANYRANKQFKSETDEQTVEANEEITIISRDRHLFLCKRASDPSSEPNIKISIQDIHEYFRKVS